MLPAKNYFVGQLVFVRIEVVGEMLVQCFADIVDTFNDAIHQVFLPEMGQHIMYFIIPVLGPYFLVDAFIAEHGHLVVANGDVQQNSVALCRAIHFQLKKNLGSPVDGIHKPAPRFYKNPDLATGAPFGFADGAQDAVGFLGRKKLGLFLPGK